MVDEEAIGERYRALAGELDERRRRLWAAAEARSAGRGGIAAVVRATGISESTVLRGLSELGSGEPLAAGRIRRPGGGRKPLSTTDPTLVADLERLVDPESRGDPQGPLRWTAKSVRNLAEGLRALGHQVSHMTVARLLPSLGYSLQANSKRREGSAHPDRDAQFHHINRTVAHALEAGEPVIFLDTKKSTWSRGPRGRDEMLARSTGRGRRLLIGACEPARSLARGPSGPGIVAVSTNPRIV